MVVVGRRAAPWVTALAEASDRFEAVDVPGADPERVRVLVVAGLPTEPLPDWPHLGLVQSLWHGVDALVGHPLLPPDVPIARLVDPGVPAAMARFVTRIVLDRSQRVDEYAELAARAEWRPLAHLTPSDVTVGLLGLGAVGRAIAEVVGGLGHPVLGWRSVPEPVPGVDVHTAPDGLVAVVERADVLVNTLPSTPATRSLLTADLLARLPDRAAFVNVGRGDVIAEAELLAGLAAGHPAVAHLDVFETEPLPADSPFWTHSQVVVTPHVSGPTTIATALEALVDNLHRALSGEPPRWVVDRERGY